MGGIGGNTKLHPCTYNKGDERVNAKCKSTKLVIAMHGNNMGLMDLSARVVGYIGEWSMG